MTPESLKSIRTFTQNYLMIAGLLIAGWLFSRFTGSLVHDGFTNHGGTTLLVFFEVIVILVFGFFAYELAKPTVIPSFVLAIFIGMLERTSLTRLTSDSATLGILTIIGASLILFGGGLDTPFNRFRKLFLPILSIAFLGTIITAILFSFFVQSSAAAFGFPLSVGTIVVLGAALASTDPAAIIPSLKSLFFPNPRVKDIAISESAINDVVGAVLTGVLLIIVSTLTVADSSSILSIYSQLLTAETGIEVLKELIVGCGVGVFGFLILHLWSRWKSKHGEGGEADAALFLAVPMVCFALAVFLHGNGFLAVFIAGLLFKIEEHVSHVEHYFVHTIEGFMKPLIFMLLGASVDLSQLMDTAIFGIIAGLVFMFVVRPIAVFVTLAPFMKTKVKMTLRELLFLSFVRETGVIPAVLLMGLSVSGIPGTEIAVPIGLWVILLTLVVQPPLTPLIARLLKIAESTPALPLRKHKGPTAVLCSRRNSFERRIAAVVEWADQHGISNITLLHCAEDEWSEESVKVIRARAEARFKEVTKNRPDDKKAITFEFLGQPGLLQDNMERFVEQEDVSIVFVGFKMLDYHLEDVKKLRVPFVFLP